MRDGARAGGLGKPRLPHDAFRRFGRVNLVSIQAERRDGGSGKRAADRDTEARFARAFGRLLRSMQSEVKMELLA